MTGLKTVFLGRNFTMRELIAQNNKLRDQLAEKKKEIEKLKEYAQHKFGCEMRVAQPKNIYGEESKCTCGLDELTKQS